MYEKSGINSYIEKIQKQLYPTELGKIVNKLLTENFADVINVEFTAQIENEFEFTYFFYNDKNKYLSPDKAILSILSQKPFIKAEEIAIKIGKTRRTVQAILKELKEKNLIIRKGSKKTGYWVINK